METQKADIAGRALLITSLAPGLAEVERLRLIGIGISKQIEYTESFIIIQQSLVAELKQKHQENVELLLAAVMSVDSVFMGLVPGAPAPQVEEKKTRGRKSKETTNEAAQTEAETERSKTRNEVAGGSDSGSAEPVKFPCPHCDDVFYKEGFLVEHLQTAHKGVSGAAPGSAVLQDDSAVETYSPSLNEIEAVSDEFAQVQAAEGLLDQPGTQLAVVVFEPLDEALGDCELCQGYGVIEGEIYGEFTLVPCTCEAGTKVRNNTEPASTIALAKCCEDCSIENPECANCNLPDMDVPFTVEESAVTVQSSLHDRLKEAQQSPCKHPMTQRHTEPDGSLVCDACGYLLKPAPVTPCENAQCSNFDKIVRDHCGISLPNRKFKAVADCPLSKPEAESTKVPSTLQSKCPHPKPFREQTEHGTKCKVCQSIIDQPGLFAAA
jgi:hypothetical protein